MRFVGKKTFPSLAQGAKEQIHYDAGFYLGNKTGVTLSSAVWSSDPSGLTFSSQSDSSTKSSVFVTVPESAKGTYHIKCKMTFSDGAIRSPCASMKVVCDHDSSTDY